jgi:ABC-type Co2+ transport system permease subunit
MDPLVAAAGWILALVILAIATRVLNRRIEERHIPLMALLAAGIFVAQMLNFPIGGGTTGHLVGHLAGTLRRRHGHNGHTRHPVPSVR